MKAQDLCDLADRIRDGQELPRRVVIDAAGTATSPLRAWRDHGVWPAICFIRNDGWTLGAPVPLAGVAYALWSDSWAAVAPVPPRLIEPCRDN